MAGKAQGLKPEPSQPRNGNRILAGLPPDEYDLLAPHLQAVSLTLTQVLFRTNDQISHVYFPNDSIVSLLTDLSDGQGMEVGLVGAEGIVGVSAILGGRETKVATVQGSGRALKVPAQKLRETFQLGGKLQKLLLAYTHFLLTQVSQSVVCNSKHPLDGRLARWLLMYNDRLGRNEFELTQEFMASMLGVRRAGVSEVAAILQDRGLIRYRRGRIMILDRKGLEALTCECYSVVKEGGDAFLS